MITERGREEPEAGRPSDAGRPAPGRPALSLSALRLGDPWQSPVTWPGYWLAGLLVVSAGYAVAVAIFSSDPVHRLWGDMAAIGYGVAALAVLAARGGLLLESRLARWGIDLALAASLLGALLVPLSVMAVRHLRQPEVDVVARSAYTLIHHGTPYASATALAATSDPNAYNPYLPVMALFGLPRALVASPVTDPRIWFGLAFLVVFAWALRAGGARDTWRWTVLVAASPVVALELAVGGTDVPMVAFLCLGFALLASQPAPRVTLAAIALGIAAGMKATAWPGLVVAIVMLAARDGWRAAARFTGVAVAVAAVCIGPFLSPPRELVVNTIEFPLGLTRIRSAAASPLPGHLLAGLGHAGHTAVVGLLGLTALAVAATLVIRPPRTVHRAVFLLVWAMSLMFLLAPSTRFGYFIYPGTLALWLLAVTASRDGNDQHVVAPACGPSHS
ncbi:MAG TPA: glycosyltransferase 87 family protein [Trebonia sp.]|nr:glycosyltransferase 87 family protein [Trebonia sp.]